MAQDKDVKKITFLNNECFWMSLKMSSVVFFSLKAWLKIHFKDKIVIKKTRQNKKTFYRVKTPIKSWILVWNRNVKNDYALLIAKFLVLVNQHQQQKLQPHKQQQQLSTMYKKTTQQEPA